MCGPLVAAVQLVRCPLSGDLCDVFDYNRESEDANDAGARRLLEMDEGSFRFVVGSKQVSFEAGSTVCVNVVVQGGRGSEESCLLRRQRMAGHGHVP